MIDDEIYLQSMPLSNGQRVGERTFTITIVDSAGITATGEFEIIVINTINEVEDSDDEDESDEDESDEEDSDEDESDEEDSSDEEETSTSSDEDESECDSDSKYCVSDSNEED